MSFPPPYSNLFSEALDQERRVDPYPIYRRMREHAVLEGPRGLFAVTRFADVDALLRDPRVASDLRRSAGEGLPRRKGAERERLRKPPFLFLDRPDHTRLRSLAAGEFRPRLIRRLQPRVTELVDELLDAAAERGRLELVEDLAQPLPLAVICDLLGVPQEDVSRFREWSRAMSHMLEPSMTVDAEERYAIARAVIDFQGYIGDLVAARRAAPRDDYISALIAAGAGADELSEQEIMTTLNLLLVAGHETTTNLLTNTMLALLRHREELARLEADPRRVADIVEETLRYDPPVQFRIRTLLADVAVDGSVIPAHSHIVLLLASANRDPRRFTDPDRFHPGRRERRHLAFGAGPHFCIGAALARLEAQTALTALSRRLENPRLTPDPLSYRRSASLRGPERLEIKFDSLRPSQRRTDRLVGSSQLA